ncbi:SDR family NAD(P)-dependent oxidoreductase [Bifidobacterium vespertilionis]|uniref:SDR family NAD(P)-dependent oxidoreductase n=1 Tax=Bifidobacterium vespertilionis TaxID=2562524 RepID=UPI001BDBF681|nr:SDR family NAD(P)-dependent oxidoreductase [Bifidobacterium vespertilionis]MBT1179127.1 SDR family NAD(P)-dependent oxidoreductase [Bifidobacterium vespertilionis]
MTTPNNTEHANIAVITGASSGLGEQFYETIAHRYPDLDEIWLIARRKERLEALAERYPNIRARVRALAFDLSAASSYDELSSMLAEEQPVVRVLINNAGFEREGLLRDMTPKDILAMIDLNIMGMTMVNRVFSAVYARWLIRSNHRIGLLVRPDPMADGVFGEQGVHPFPRAGFA